MHNTAGLLHTVSSTKSVICCWKSGKCKNLQGINEIFLSQYKIMKNYDWEADASIPEVAAIVF